MTNAELRRNVEDELEWEPSINATDIGVTAHDGIVTLTGTVSSNSEKLRAAKVAQRVRGVNAVANDIELRLPGTDVRSDAEIAQLAFDALKERTLVPDGRIKVSVSHGWVYLSGEVDWRHEKCAAFELVHSLVGVKGVFNQITVKPKASVPDVKSQLEAAFRRSAELHGQPVRVESKNGKVTLLGRLHKWSERQEAERMAWSAPGVSEVENLIMLAE
jgi:osmotically-inducible protein OsmY